MLIRHGKIHSHHLTQGGSGEVTIKSTHRLKWWYVLCASAFDDDALSRSVLYWHSSHSSEKNRTRSSSSEEWSKSHLKCYTPFLSLLMITISIAISDCLGHNKTCWRTLNTLKKNLYRGIQQQSMKELSGIGNGVNGKKRIKVSREHWILIKVLFWVFEN